MQEHIALFLAGAIIFALSILSLFATDDNYNNVQFFKCDDCQDFISRKPSDKKAVCKNCNKLMRKLKNW